MKRPVIAIGRITPRISMGLQIARTVKHITRWTIVGISTLLLLVGLLFGLVQTEWAKQQLAEWLAASLSSGPNVQVRFVGLRGLVPFNVRLDQIVIGDADGDWLRIKEVALHWSPGALLKGRIIINRLFVVEMQLSRLPASHNGKERHQWTWPTWPTRMASLILEEFTIQRLLAGEPLLGEQAIFAVHGGVDAEDSTGGLKGYLSMDRTDGATAFAHIIWSLNGEDRLLSLDLVAEEEKGILSKSVFGLEQTGALSIELQGEGPIEAWKGRLTGKGDKLGTIESAIEFMVQEDLRLSADGQIVVDPSLFPTKVAPLLKQGENHFTLDVQFRPEKTLVIHHLALESQSSHLRLEGQLDLQRQWADLELAFGLADISFLREITGSRVGGRAAIEGRLQGPFQKLRSTLSLSVFEPAFAELRASKMECDLELEAIGELPASFQGLSVRTNGHVNGLSAPLGKGIMWPETQFQWSVAADLRNKSPVTVSELEISSKSIRLKFSGTLDPFARSLRGDALLEMQALHQLSDLLGTELTGSAQMQAQLNGDGSSRSFSANIKGQIKGLGPLQPFLAALAGNEITYGGRVELLGTGHLKVSGFRARSSSVELTGEADTDLSTRNTTAQGHLSIPQLSLFSGPVGHAIGGSLTLEMEFGGTLSDPTIRAKATGREVGIKDVFAEQVVIALRAEDLRKKPRGSLELELRQPDYSLNAASDFLLDRPRLVLSGVSIAVPGTEASGDLTMDLQTLTGEGSFQGNAHDLSRFSTLWGEKIGGSARFELVFLKRETKQDLELTLQGSKLASRFGYANEFGLRAHLTDLFGAQLGTAEMQIESFQKEKLDLQSLTFAAEGQIRKASFSGSAVGRYEKTFELQTQGGLELSPDNVRIQVDQLHGKFEDYPFELLQSAVMRRESHDYILEKVAFHVGEGRFEASGRVGPNDLVLDARLEGLPLETFHVITPTEFLGSVNGHFQIAGQLSHPEAHIELGVEKIRLKRPEFQEFPSASLSANMEVKEDGLQADLSLEGLSEKAFKANIRVPAIISLSPPSFSLASKDKAQGQALIEGDLSLIPTFFYLEDQSLEGHLSMDLVLAGWGEVPEIRGTIRISNGLYENSRSGTIFKDLQMLAKCEHDRIVLEKAQATDGAEGTVSLQGWLQLLPAEGFPFQWDLALINSTLLRRDDLTAIASGGLRVSGTVDEALLSGDLTVGPAEIQIPESFPPEVPDLEVEEINRPGLSSTEKPAGRKLLSRLNLDLKVDVPGRVFVRGRGLDSEWKGTFHVAGTAREPSIKGRLSVIRGRYNFLGKAFSLTNGELAFNGNLPPSPDFDVSAEHRRSDMTAYIRLSGNPTSLNLDMDSDPHLPSDEILSHLLFGRSVASISPLQALRLAQAVNTIAGGGSAFNFMDRTRRILGVDRLEISQSNEGNREASVTAGKYLSDNIYLEIEKGVGTEGGRISSEVELTPNITFESETGTDAQVGVGINWKWDY